MAFKTQVCKVLLFSAALSAIHGSVDGAEPVQAGRILAGDKIRVEGRIMSRDGDLITIREKKSGKLIGINLFEDTKVERKTGRFLFERHPRMDVTAMVPGLTIEAEGVGNAKGQLDAKKITFRPDEFAVAIAQQQQITATAAAVQRAQSTADQGLNEAKSAQTSADQAQVSAEKAQGTADKAAAAAQMATAIGVIDADAIELINRRVSELDEYTVVAETSVYFGNHRTALDAAGMEALSELGELVNSANSYMIEIVGYASASGPKRLNQKLSEERAASVAEYLRQTKNIPLRRILAPVGYGASRSTAPKGGSDDQARDRRVDVRVLVNNGTAYAQ